MAYFWVWTAERFVDWLQGGDAPPNTLTDNLQCAVLLFAALESAHTNQVIAVQDFLQNSLDRVSM